MSWRHATSQHDVMTSCDVTGWRLYVIMSGSITERCQFGNLLSVTWQNILAYDVTSCDVTEWRQDVSWCHRMTSNNDSMAKTTMTYTREVRQRWDVFIKNDFAAVIISICYVRIITYLFVMIIRLFHTLGQLSVFFPVFWVNCLRPHLHWMPNCLIKYHPYGRYLVLSDVPIMETLNVDHQQLYIYLHQIYLGKDKPLSKRYAAYLKVFCSLYSCKAMMWNSYSRIGIGIGEHF